MSVSSRDLRGSKRSIGLWRFSLYGRRMLRGRWYESMRWAVLGTIAFGALLAAAAYPPAPLPPKPQCAELPPALIECAFNTSCIYGLTTTVACAALPGIECHVRRSDARALGALTCRLPC